MNSKNGLVAVALDYDGVIVDSMALQEKAWRGAARDVAVPHAVEEALVRNLYRGYSGNRMFEGLGLLPEVKRKLRAAKDTRWESELAKVPLFSGAAEGIRRLAGLCHIGIATTAQRQHVDRVLTREGLQDCIVAIVTDRDAPRPKPYPDMLVNLICGPLQADADSSLMVGDTDTDRQMAMAAGVEFLRFDAGKKETTAHQMTVTSWRDLVGLVIGRVAV